MCCRIPWPAPQVGDASDGPWLGEFLIKHLFFAKARFAPPGGVSRRHAPCAVRVVVGTSETVAASHVFVHSQPACRMDFAALDIDKVNGHPGQLFAHMSVLKRNKSQYVLTRDVFAWYSGLKLFMGPGELLEFDSGFPFPKHQRRFESSSDEGLLGEFFGQSLAEVRGKSRVAGGYVHGEVAAARSPTFLQFDICVLDVGLYLLLRTRFTLPERECDFPMKDARAQVFYFDEIQLVISTLCLIKALMPSRRSRRMWCKHFVFKRHRVIQMVGLHLFVGRTSSFVAF